MAYNFVRSSSQYLTATLVNGVGVPMTLFAAFKTSNTTDALVMLSTNTTANNSGNRNMLYLNGSDEKVYASAVFSNSADALTTTTYSTAAANAAAVFLTAISRSAFLNGSGKGTNTTTTATQSALANIGIGARYNGTSWGAFMDGDLAEIAVWSAALTDREINSLGKGFRPSKIRPQSLVFYAPLLRTLQDVKSGNSITNNNTATVANHPRVYA